MSSHGRRHKGAILGCYALVLTRSSVAYQPERAPTQQATQRESNAWRRYRPRILISSLVVMSVKKQVRSAPTPWHCSSEALTSAGPPWNTPPPARTVRFWVSPVHATW
jgi:hypothetical protein